MAGDVRIAVIGQAAFGESVLNALVEEGENVVGVFCPPDREGRRPDPIKAAAEGHDVPVLQFRRMRNQDAIDAFKELNSDICVMAFVTDIVPDEILEAPSKGTIQYHPSLLPLHRGPSSINWHRTVCFRIVRRATRRNLRLEQDRNKRLPLILGGWEPCSSLSRTPNGPVWRKTSPASFPVTDDTELCAQAVHDIPLAMVCPKLLSVRGLYQHNDTSHGKTHRGLV